MLGFLKNDSPAAAATRLTGERVYLRPPCPGDWRPWAELRTASRAFLQPWEPRWADGALTSAAFRRRLRRQARESREDTGYSFFVFLREDDVHVGGVNFSEIQRGVAMSCTLGYWIGARYARQGLMTEAVGCVLPFAFETLGLNRVEAACLPTNTASERLLRTLGFRQEGFARDYLRINGEWRDHLLFAMRASDNIKRSRGKG
ncbi:MAG: GNAT family N-acetyltransferase [Proteobacteria bacterium]|nr:GNAT family N-acetyltransferase [Pseudomonadota bacterium]